VYRLLCQAADINSPVSSPPPALPHLPSAAALLDDSFRLDAPPPPPPPPHASARGYGLDGGFREGFGAEEEELDASTSSDGKSRRSRGREGGGGTGDEIGEQERRPHDVAPRGRERQKPRIPSLRPSYSLPNFIAITNSNININNVIAISPRVLMRVAIAGK